MTLENHDASLEERLRRNPDTFFARSEIVASQPTLPRKPFHGSNSPFRMVDLDNRTGRSRKPERRESRGLLGISRFHRTRRIKFKKKGKKGGKLKFHPSRNLGFHPGKYHPRRLSRHPTFPLTLSHSYTHAYIYTYAAHPVHFDSRQFLSHYSSLCFIFTVIIYGNV